MTVSRQEVIIEIGRGCGDFLNVFGASECVDYCPIPSSRFECIRHNGDLVVRVLGGITRDTLGDFKDLAECCK